MIRGRLHAGAMFERNDDEENASLNRICFISVEGNETEINYFDLIQKHSTSLGIRKCVKVHSLRRSHKDTNSDPQQVIDLLEEYLEVRNAKSLPELLKSRIPDLFPEDFIARYLMGEDVDETMKKEFEINLELSGIDLSYVKFLNSYKTDRDVFAVVIDKDGHSHDTEKLKRIAEHCKAKGYMLFLSNPCFEFWLLLHVCNVKEEYDRLEDFLENKKVSRNHTFTSRELSLRVHHAKRITEPKFIKYYLNNVDTAIKRVRRDFTDNLSKLIGYADASKGGQLGSNLPELFDMLREESQVQ